MRIALVDDTKELHPALAELVRHTFSTAGITISEFDSFESGEALLSAENNNYDLILMDILMDGLNGIDTARRLRENGNRVPIVFCSTSNDFAAESYTVEACYYLLKPVSEEAMLAMIERLRLSDIIKNRYLDLPNGTRLLLRSIVYTSCASHTISFYLTDHSVRNVRMSQTELGTLLLGLDEFYNCHKGIFVNFEHVKKEANCEFTMTDGSIVPISRRKKSETHDAFARYLFEKSKRS